MGTIVQEDYTNNLFTLLKETFEGPPPNRGSAYLDQGGGLFQTIDKVNAETASRSVTNGAPTIAAHCEHIRFYVLVLDRFMRGETEKADWKQSWLVQTVNPDEWEKLKGDLRQSYSTVTEHLRAVETWDDDPVGDGMAIVIHTAYHLGAIRQLVRILSEQA